MVEVNYKGGMLDSRLGLYPNLIQDTSEPLLKQIIALKRYCVDR